LRQRGQTPSWHKGLAVAQIKAGFSVDNEKLKRLGVVDPRSKNSMALFKSGALTSDERLYLSLWGSPLLKTVSMEAKRKIVTAGSPIDEAYFIISGSLLATAGSDIYRLGPGSVVGLAEGIVNKPSAVTVVTVSPVQAHIIPFHKIDNIIALLPLEVKSILLTIIKRTLALP
jgi:CRP-like cAMP-binding protein